MTIKVKFTLPLLVSIALFAVILGITVSAETCLAADATYFDISPSPGGTTDKHSPSIVGYVKDTDGLNNSAKTITIDGQNTAVMLYDWMYVTYIPPWAEDPNVEPVEAANPGILSDGSHTVAISILDLLGNKNSYQWSFTVAVPPTFSGHNPAKELATTKVTSNNKTISVKITDPNGGSINPGSVTMSLDGTNVTPIFDPATGIATYTSPEAIPDGKHTVSISASDTAGNSSKDSWSFYVLTTKEKSPILIDITPAEGLALASGTNQFTVTCNVYDSDHISNVSGSYYIKVNGTILPTTFKYSIGHQGNSGWTSTWVVDDYNYATFTGHAIDLSTGPQTVEVMVTDQQGNAVIKTWTFYVAGITDVTPAKNAILTSSMSILELILFENNVTRDNVTLYYNNEPVSYDFNSINGNTAKISFVPPVPMKNETSYPVKLVVRNGANVNEYSWNYYVNPWGGLLNLAWDSEPVGKTCTYCHTGALLKEFILPSIPNPTNVEYEPTETWVADHIIGDAREGLPTTGDPIVVTTTFNIVHKIYEKGADGLYHQNTLRCQRCHGTPNADTNSSNCSAYYCHGSAFDFYALSGHAQEIMTKCDFCHGPPVKNRYYFDDISWWIQSSKDGHNIGDKHLPDNNTSDCEKCHSKYLFREHQRRTTADGQPLDCNTCHGTGAPQNVKDAVTNHNGNCSSCHESIDHQAQHNFGLSPGCLTCHLANLTDEHLNNPKTTAGKNFSCSTCHNGPASAKLAIAFDQTLCSDCHDTGHQINFSPTIPESVYKYPGFAWTNPLDTMFFDETWLPSGAANGKLIISNARSGINGDDVFASYNSQLTSAGWKLTAEPPAGGSNSYTVSFSKDSKKLVLNYQHKADPEGSRIKMYYDFTDSPFNDSATTPPTDPVPPNAGPIILEYSPRYSSGGGGNGYINVSVFDQDQIDSKNWSLKWNGAPLNATFNYKGANFTSDGTSAGMYYKVSDYRMATIRSQEVYFAPGSGKHLFEVTFYDKLGNKTEKIWTKYNY